MGDRAGFEGRGEEVEEDGEEGEDEGGGDSGDEGVFADGELEAVIVCLE